MEVFVKGTEMQWPPQARNAVGGGSNDGGIPCLGGNAAL